MARYAGFLGRTVEVQYRAGDILLPASGTLVGDSGRSVFLEQHFLQRGQEKHFRWEIPYQCIVRLEAKALAASAASAGASVPARLPATTKDLDVPSTVSLLMPLPNDPETV
jgi:hypothetical protein